MVTTSHATGLEKTLLYVWATVVHTPEYKHDVQLPVGGHAGEVEDEVVVDQGVRLVEEPVLGAVCPDGTRPGHRLTEVTVHRGPGRGLQPLQLAGCGDVEPLGRHKYNTLKVIKRACLKPGAQRGHLPE